MDKRILLTLVVLVLLGGAYLFIPMSMSSGYTAITTTSNQFFIGKAYKAHISDFIELRSPFLFQSTPDATDKTKTTSQLVDLSVESYWLPKSIHINVDNIVTWGIVSPESNIGVKITTYLTSPKTLSPTDSPAK